MAGNAQLFGRGRQQQKTGSSSAKRLNEAVFGTGSFRRPNQMVCFVHDEHIPARRNRLFSAPAVIQEEADAAKNELIIHEWVLPRIDGFNCSTAFFVENVEPQVEP